MGEIRALLKRGGVTPEDEKRLWDGLYLTREELKRLLDHVRRHGLEGFVYPMFAFAIYTAARRSEMIAPGSTTSTSGQVGSGSARRSGRRGPNPRDRLTFTRRWP